LKGYNIYVKRKEKELRELITKLTERNNKSTVKDDKLQQLEQSVIDLRDD
jgi:hypothetical protein